MGMSASERAKLIQNAKVAEAELLRRLNTKYRRYFPDEGPLRRELYFRIVDAFAAGSRFPERLVMGGNRTGKTQGAAYEVTCHATGLYPDWWTGKRFDAPVEIWCAGNTATTTRDIAQLELYGPIKEAPRTGMIPAHLIWNTAPKSAIPNALETIWVHHVSGGKSVIQFKSYDQRRQAFEGTAKHFIWLDEECPEDVYTECLLRTLTVKGSTLITFTPVEGLTPFVQAWLEHAVMIRQDADGNDIDVPAEIEIFQGTGLTDDKGRPVTAASDDMIDLKVPLSSRTKYLTLIGWNEVPHLDEQAQAQMIGSIPEYQRAARTRGIPHLGSGVIYPVAEEQFKVDPFPIPAHWPKGYGMDVGWKWTVAVHGAYDRDTATWYLYREHYGQKDKPVVHAEAIKGPGDWIPGRIDPAANGRSQNDGTQLLEVYQKLGLILEMAPNGVESGIFEVWTVLTGSKLKVFSNLTHWFTEYRMYRRNAKGQVIKSNDHLMDATRYLIASGIAWLMVGAIEQRRLMAGDDWAMRFDRGTHGGTWMS